MIPICCKSIIIWPQYLEGRPPTRQVPSPRGTRVDREVNDRISWTLDYPPSPQAREIIYFEKSWYGSTLSRRTICKRQKEPDDQFDMLAKAAAGEMVSRRPLVRQSHLAAKLWHKSVAAKMHQRQEMNLCQGFQMSWLAVAMNVVNYVFPCRSTMWHISRELKKMRSALPGGCSQRLGNMGWRLGSD